MLQIAVCTARQPPFGMALGHHRPRVPRAWPQGGESSVSSATASGKAPPAASGANAGRGVAGPLGRDHRQGAAGPLERGHGAGRHRPDSMATGDEKSTYIPWEDLRRRREESSVEAQEHRLLPPSSDEGSVEELLRVKVRGGMSRLIRWGWDEIPVGGSFLHFTPHRCGRVPKRISVGVALRTQGNKWKGKMIF